MKLPLIACLTLLACQSQTQKDTAPQVEEAPTTDTAEEGNPDSQTPDSSVVDVYLLAGQSNMAGLSQATGLPPSLRQQQNDVQIFWSGTMDWRALSPSSPHSTGYGLYTGPESSFGRKMADADQTKRIYLIKHAVSGTDLHTFWNPGDDPNDPIAGEGYRVFYETIQHALSDLQESGLTANVKGFLWMQGEADAGWMTSAEAYQANLAHFIARIRSDVNVAELPVVIGKIACDTWMCPERDTVREAQDRVAAEDEHVSVIETEDLGRNHDDPWHYTGQGMRVMGMRFADALLNNTPASVPEPAVTLTGEWRSDYTGNFTVGWSFSVSESIRITDVGHLDIEQDGLTHTAELAIWHRDSEEYKVFATVPGHYSGPTSLLGHFRAVGIDPVTLEAGDYIIGIQAFYQSPDRYVHEAAYVNAEPVDVTGYAHETGSVLSYPTTTGAIGETAAWFGPNFWFTQDP